MVEFERYVGTMRFVAVTNQEIGEVWYQCEICKRIDIFLLAHGDKIECGCVACRI
jgi:hypothetical protein